MTYSNKQNININRKVLHRALYGNYIALPIPSLARPLKLICQKELARSPPQAARV